MKFAEINKLFTEKVAEYIGKGYTLNAGTMSGSQGEFGKVDMTDGSAIIRIVVDSGRERIGNHIIGVEYVELLVGDASEDLGRYHVRPNGSDRMDTIWNNRLTVIERTRFYVVGENRRGEKFYGTLEEAVTAHKKQISRWSAKEDRKPSEDITEKAMEIAVRVIRNKLDITRVIRSKVKVERRNGQYTISYCGSTFRMGQERSVA